MAGNSNSGGRNAKDKKFHVLQGTFRSDRHESQDFIDPPKGAPPVPKGLSAVAKAEWERMVERLETARTLSVVDDAALYQYVRLFAETEQIIEDHAQLRKVSRDLKKLAQKLEGAELVEAIGKIVVLQQLAQKQSTQLRLGHMAIRQYLIEFGMTPSARNRVKVPKDAAPPANPLDKFVNRKRG